MKIDYLRLSVTDRCNLNCIYCTPLQKSRFLSRREVLSHEEMAEVVEFFVQAGITKLRITGGEPLIKKNIVDLVKMLKAVKGLEEIALTTNGVFLKDLAGPLKDAGLDRVNVSLDTLKEEKFRRITGSDCFARVREGINSSLECGLHPVKINVILMRGINDEEIPDFTRLAIDFPLLVRFIEFFPVNSRAEKLANRLVRTEEVKKRITRTFGEIRPAAGIVGGGPAGYFELENSRGIVGFISGSSENFCRRCNRIRIDCAGRIFPCLFSGCLGELRPFLRTGAAEEKIPGVIKSVLRMKPEYNKGRIPACEVEMSTVGG